MFDSYPAVLTAYNLGKNINDCMKSFWLVFGKAEDFQARYSVLALL